MKITYLTHENIIKTAVAKAMMYDIAVHLSKKYEISIVSASTEKNKENRFYKENGISHFKFYRSRYGMISVKDITSLMSFSLTIMKLIYKSDVVYVRSYPMMAFAPLCYFLRKKIIFDPRGLGFLEMEDSGKVGKLLPRRVLCSIEKLFIFLSDRVICVSDLHKLYYRNHYGMDHKYRVIYNGTEKLDVEPTRINVDRPIIGYVGSLIKWHCPERINSILCMVKSKGLEFEFHCVTRDVEQAKVIFDGDYNKCIYSHPYRQEPIQFDVGLCIIEDTLSKSACFPVKFSEYVAAKTPVLYSKNVDVCLKLDSKYNLGVGIDLNMSNEDIALKIINFLQSETSLKNEVELPYEITQEGMISQIDEMINTI